MPYDHYCCALRDDDDESVTGDANRGNFLAMLKLTAKMQHTFLHEALYHRLNWLRRFPRVTSTESQRMHGAKFLATMNHYAGVRQFADWSKTIGMCLCTQAVCLYACTLPCTSGERSFNDTRRLRQCQTIG